MCPVPPTAATTEVLDFIGRARWPDFPADAVTLAKRCVIDGLGVMLAGSTTSASTILREYTRAGSGHTDATAFAPEPFRTSAASAALLNGTSGHALDFDDTQLSTSADRIFGLLTHPTMPPLAAALALGERHQVSGARFLEAFLTGFEVECKIAEAIHPHHYKKGFHSSGTVGTFGATVAAAKLLGLDRDATAHALAIAASMASGIRVNFGTMTKPLHVGPGVAERRHRRRNSRRRASPAATTRSIRRGDSSRSSASATASTPTASSGSSGIRTPSSVPASRSSRIRAACSAIRRWTRCEQLVIDPRCAARDRSWRFVCARARTS